MRRKGVLGTLGRIRQTGSVRQVAQWSVVARVLPKAKESDLSIKSVRLGGGLAGQLGAHLHPVTPRRLPGRRKDEFSSDLLRVARVGKFSHLEEALQTYTK